MPLHLRSVSARLDVIVAAGVREVVVFHSSVDALLEHQAALPFATIADPGRKLYAEFGVEVARKAVLHPRTWAAAARGVLKQQRPRAALGVGESHLGLPGDFLIAPDGQLLAVKYGTHADDQWSVDELLALVPAAEPGARPTPVHRSTGRAARHLINSGRRVTVVLATTAERLGEVTAHQLDILHRMDADVTDHPAGPDAGDVDLVIDALIGYSLTGAPRAAAADLIRWANDQPAPILSLDTPSGLDVTTGRAADPCVEATVTMTLALPKTGLRAASQVGLLYLADISIPRAAYRKLGIEVGDDLFADGVATAGTWIRVAVNFIVPYLVASIGCLSGRRRPDTGEPPGS